MTDILMNNNRLPMYNGDFVLTDGIEEIKQHIVTALNTFYTDWLLNYTKGIDYAFGLRHEEFLEHDCKNQILGVNGVVSLANFNMRFNRETLEWNITAGVKTVYGKLEINEGIKL